MTDQQRADTVAALGNDLIKTPYLDQLVREGTSFSSAYSPSPECVPARCCLTMGQYPSQTKCTSNATPFPLEQKQTFMEALRLKGYRTHGIGKYHFHHDDYQKTLAGNGFQSRDIMEEIVPDRQDDDYLKYLSEKGLNHIGDPHGVRGDMYYFPQPAQMAASHHPTQWVGDRALDFIQDQEKSDQPWYCYTSFVHPHPPFAPPAPWHKLYRDKDMDLPYLPDNREELKVFINHVQNRYKRGDRGLDLNRMRMIKAYYYACISFIDFQIGRIIRSLEATGQLDNTLIIFTADHGELLGDFGCFGKRSFHDAAAQIPLIMRLPGEVPANRLCATPVNLIDVTKTLLARGNAEMTTHPCEGGDLVTPRKPTRLKSSDFFPIPWRA